MALNNQILKNMPPVVKNLILINVLVFVVQVLAPPAKGALIDRYLALHYFSSPDFNPAQLFTYMFLHGGFTHILFNMFALWMFGCQIEYAIGSRRFLFYYISCGVGAALVQEGVFALMLTKYNGMFTPEQMQQIIIQGNQYMRQDMTYADPTLASINGLVNGISVGASGAIYGILLAFGMLWPNAQLMLLIPPIPVKAKYMVLAWVGIELLLGLSNRPGDNVAHFCHLGGMLIGLIILLYWKKQGPLNGHNGFY